MAGKHYAEAYKQRGMRVLAALKNTSAPMNCTQIAARIGVHPSGLMGTLNRLLDNLYVFKAENRLRRGSFLYEITPKGRTALAEYLEAGGTLDDGI